MHMIDSSNMRDNMAYVGDVPWHGLGEQLTVGAPIETWQVQAGMSHSIERSRVAFRFGNESGQVATMDNRHVLWRSDTHAPLAVVSDGFKIVQPRDVLEFFRDLVGATGDYELETAGVLNDGRTYWALARYNNALQFGSDNVQPYLLLATACDGSMATTAQLTSVRVVCHNTLSMSLSRSGSGIAKVRHSSVFNGDAIKQQLGVTDTVAEFADDIEMLINKSITRAESVDVLVELIGKRDNMGQLTNEQNMKRVTREIMLSLVNAPGAHLDTAAGTGWGLMNAVTHYVDFKARARSDNNRFNSGQFGAGAKLKTDAFALIQAA